MQRCLTCGKELVWVAIARSKSGVTKSAWRHAGNGARRCRGFAWDIGGRQRREVAQPGILVVEGERPR